MELIVLSKDRPKINFIKTRWLFIRVSWQIIKHPKKGFLKIKQNKKEVRPTMETPTNTSLWNQM